MKKVTFILTVLPLVTALFLGGCADMLMERPNVPELAEGEGLLVISLAGANVGAGPALTMLPPDPQFTRYELDFGGSPANISFYNSVIQLPLPNGSYSITVNGYLGDKIVAKSDPTPVDVTAGVMTPVTFTLKPRMETEPGVLDFSLNWDGLAYMPYRAELKIEKFAKINGDLIEPPEPIPHDSIPSNLTPGSAPGTILLLQKNTALVGLTGALPLPPGQYLITMIVTMAEGAASVERTDLAHIYSNLSTPAPFFYGAGDLYISNTSPDSGASFITGFTFTQTPSATTVIGSEPGVDGTRMIMIMVPPGTGLTALNPDVTCAEGSFITSPAPPAGASPLFSHVTYAAAMDFTNPMVWTAQAKNGAVQKYTVVVSKTPDTSDDKMITSFYFKNYPDSPGAIDQSGGTINVTLPYASSSPLASLIPVITFIGKSVSIAGEVNPPNGINGFNFTSPPRTFNVYSALHESDTPKTYNVTVTMAGNTAAEITRFAIDGYPGRAVTSAVSEFGTIGVNSEDGTDEITLRLPYGVSLKNLTPLVQYEGKSLEPASGTPRNFGAPVLYTVTPESGTAKTYKVTITNDPPDRNTGIFDFKVTNVPTAKVVIGQKPRQDGKIPIVIQVPYGTDENNMIAAITLSSSTSTINPGSGKIDFGNPNYQEAVYTVTSQGIPLDPDPLKRPATQDYVVVVSEGPQYYYVDGTSGRDDWPDYYNGGSESHPFKTLAYAVQKAQEPLSGISKIFLMGDLTAAAGGNSSSSSEGSFVLEGISPYNPITITSTTGAVIRGDGTKRALEIKGAANLVFENISVTGGNANGTNAGANNDGGGIYVTGNSKVKFSGGSITGNTARNGGGVYVEADDGASDFSEFTFMNGTISGNTATGAVADNSADWEADPLSSPKMGGGGGVYVNGKALFWLASGTISGNTTKGAGGGVLVNGTVDDSTIPITEYGLLMTGGTISANTTTSTTYPHGGGGVYVAHGAFDMEDGSVTGNNATRQGGGVFIHWGAARFTAAGNSSITGNEGVGSSKAICNRGTAAMTDNARADKVYIWDYDEDDYDPITDPEQSFTLAKGAQVSGLVLAYSAHDKNFVTIAGIEEPTDLWNGPVCTIDLESRLIGGLLHGPISDWYGHRIIFGANDALKKLIADSLSSGTVSSIEGTRLPLNTFTGSPSLSNLENKYRIVVTDAETVGKFQPRP